MNQGREAYLRLAELFDTIVPSALSELLKKLMASKVKGYKHESSWWSENKACLSRAPPIGIEISHVQTKEPNKWSMNLLVKVLKYCNHDLVDRYGVVWGALDALIRARKTVLEYQDTKSVSDTDFQNCISSVYDKGIAVFALPDPESIDDDIDELKRKKVEDDGQYHKRLLRQEREWAQFEEKLYEEGGKPTIKQLQLFHVKSGNEINIVEKLTPHCSSLTAFLLNDEDGTKLEVISLKWNRDVTRMADNIFSQWCKTGDRATWRKLVKCIKHIGLDPLARDIADSLI